MVNPSTMVKGWTVLPTRDVSVLRSPAADGHDTTPGGPTLWLIPVDLWYLSGDGTLLHFHLVSIDRLSLDLETYHLCFGWQAVCPPGGCMSTTRPLSLSREINTSCERADSSKVKGQSPPTLLLATLFSHHRQQTTRPCRWES